MYSTIIQKIDMMNICFAIIAVIALIINTNTIVEAIILIIATLTLLLSKYRYNKVNTFFTYFSSTLFFGLLFSKAADEATLNSFMLPANYLTIIVISLLTGAIAILVKLGSNTLSVLFLSLHILMYVAAFQMSENLSFIQTLWSSNAQLYTIREFYPFLLAGMLIGVFFEKYQFEMKRDRQNR